MPSYSIYISSLIIIVLLLIVLILYNTKVYDYVRTLLATVITNEGTEKVTLFSLL